MKKFFIVIITCIFVIFGMVFYMQNAEDNEFMFSITYQIGERNYISSIDGIIVLDTIDGEIEENIRFTDEEMSILESKFLSLELYDVRSTFSKVKNRSVHPNEINSLSIYYKKKSYKYNWSTNDQPPINIVYDESSYESQVEIESDENSVVVNTNEPYTTQGIVRKIISVEPKKGYEDEYEDYKKLCDFKDTVLEVIQNKGIKDKFTDLKNYE